MSVERVPTIDLALAAQGERARDELAERLDWACREYGFFYLVGHGVREELIERLERVSREFFARPLEHKRQIDMSKGGRAWRGYFAVGDELTSGVPDRKEGIYFGTELDDTDERVRRGLPLHGRNQFPDILGFREAVLDYIDALEALAQRVLGLLARGLGLPEETFVRRYTSDPTILFRIFNYPADPVARADNSWGVGEHTDYGLLTLVRQDEIGGLQVRHGDRWIDVPPIPESFVCNVGDMLERVTNGRYLSALHRVQNASRTDRLSMAFFFDPSFSATLAPIDGITPAHDTPHTNVRWDHIDPKSVSGTYGDYLLAKVAKVFPELMRQVG